MKFPTFIIVSVLTGSVVGSRGNTISINFVDDPAVDSMLPTDEAGPAEPPNVARASHWNNIQAAAAGSAVNLIRQDGVATTAKVDFTTDLGPWRLGYELDAASTGDDKMWKGYLDAQGTNADAPGATVTVSGVPFTSYDVYIYFDGDNGGEWRVANYQVTSSVPAVSAFGEDSENASWGTVGEENEAKVYQIPVAGGGGNAVWPVSPNNSEGNMVRFPGMRGSSFTIKAWGSSNTFRAGINGFQIVESLDSDGDGLPDEWEILHQLDPNSTAGNDGATGDPDTDGLNNLGELNRGSDPQLGDTDGDKLSDLVETNTGTWVSATNTGTDPLQADSDGDGLTDNVENPTQATLGFNQSGTNPNSKDGDSDGVDDGTEVAFGTDPKLNTSIPALQANKLDLLAYWPFNVDSQDTVLDVQHGLPGTLLVNAAITPDAAGHTGAAGDRAVDLGPGQTGSTVEVLPAGLLNLAAAQDQVAISYWQKLYTVSGSRAFYAPFVPAAGADPRGLSAHATWSDNNFYWDTAGCCDGTTQRISAANPGIDLLKWHHIVFQKNGPLKEIWVDGQLVGSGENTAPLPDSFSRLYIGSWSGGAEQTQGLIDDFAVFGDSLTENQIKRLFTGTSPTVIAAETDTDSDGMPDSYEDANNFNKNSAGDAALDADGDTLSNFTEFQRATNPQKPDSDDDGLSDKAETATGTWVSAADTGTNPLIADTDGDGLKDGAENNSGTFTDAASSGTSPFTADSDEDGYSDYEEVQLGSNPVQLASIPALPMAIGYWPFDDQGPSATTDLSPGANHGTVNGGPVYVAGHSGGPNDFALQFDGTDDSVTTGVPLLASLTSFTMSGWVKMPDTQTGNRKGLFGQNDVVEFGMITPTTMEYWTPNGGAISAIIENGTLPDWTHVAVVATGGARRILLNGVEASAGTIGAPAASASGFNIGGGGVQDATGNFFIGLIDDVAVWNKALTDEQITALAARTLTPRAAVPGFQPADPGFAITGIARNATTGALTLTWGSTPGETYSIKYSTTLSSFTGDLGVNVPAAPAPAVTTSHTFNNPTPAASRLFLRVLQQ